MNKRIIWSPRAADDLEDVYNYIAKDSKYFAALIVRKIFKIVESIPQFTRSGRIVPEYQNEKLRERLYKNYRIIYRIKEEVIEIVAIFHGAQLLSDL